MYSLNREILSSRAIRSSLKRLRRRSSSAAIQSRFSWYRTEFSPFGRTDATLTWADWPAREALCWRTTSLCVKEEFNLRNYTLAFNNQALKRWGRFWCKRMPKRSGTDPTQLHRGATKLEIKGGSN